MTDRTTDKALENPESDLLDLAPHAEMLARIVTTAPTPFTIGVYGEWGAGKTTFANFVKYFLNLQTKRKSDTQKVEFIRFESWPHKTADELWRALIIKIAAQLYFADKQPEPEGKAESQVHTTWRDWLTRDAILLRKPEEKKTDESEYRELLAKLDSTLFGGIGKSGAARWRLDQEQVLVSAVTAGFSALSAASPFMAGLRSLLKLNDDSAPGTAQREQNEQTRARIESIDEFRKVLKDLLEKKGKGNDDKERRLCIFLDDLDRCTPDVAVDLLDAIKVFLTDARFVFILAADEQIIGRGLRMRYRDLMQLDDKSESIAEALKREGEQYFEKIVQLRIVIPEARAHTAHRFIAAQFPEWMPATDIIFAALGSNPRRIKQYCNWMQYRLDVEELQMPVVCGNARPQPAKSQDDIALLNKMIALNARSENCRREIAGLAAGADFQQKMLELEQHLVALGEDAEDDAIAARMTDPSLIGLCRVISASEPLYALIVEPKRLSEFEALRVETFAAIADMRPQPATILEASDRLFMRILGRASGSTTAQAVVIDDFGRLRSIETRAPKLLTKLLELAESARLAWSSQMLEIEAGVQAGRSPDSFGQAQMKAVMAEVNELPISDDPATDRRALLLTSPRLSEMLREVILAYCGVRAELPDGKDLLAKRVAQQASEEQVTQRLARHAFDKLSLENREDLEKRINLRTWAADHCLRMRSFAKLNALERNWPAVAGKLRDNFLALRAMENAIASDSEIDTRYTNVWEPFKSNDKLCRFLRLQPLFGSMDPMQVQKYLEFSQAVVSAEPLPAAAASPSAASIPTADAAGEIAEYINASLRISLLSQAGDIATYSATLEIDDAVSPPYDINLSWPQIDRQDELLRNLVTMGPNNNGPTRELMDAREGKWQELASLGDYQTLMREIGTATFETVFADQVRPGIEALLGGSQRFRIAIEAPGDLMKLPLESMYSRKQRGFLALTPDVSLVRRRALPRESRRLPLTLPLRILVVLANPPESPPLNIEGEQEVLQRALEPAQAAGRVVINIIGRGGATWEAIDSTVKSFRPHVFHFVGHGVFGAEAAGAEERGSIVLDGPGGSSHFLGAPEFETLLGGQKIQVAVLNGCDTGTAARNQAITSLADALISSGVPSVIATMRAVTDDSALLFTREFYRAFCEGQPLESALAQARKALSIERRDWSVYALFASMSQLEWLRIPAAVPQRGPGTPAP